MHHPDNQLVPDLVAVDYEEVPDDEDAEMVEFEAQLLAQRVCAVPRRVTCSRCGDEHDAEVYLRLERDEETE